jgi:hypothetical protein
MGNMNKKIWKSMGFSRKMIYFEKVMGIQPPAGVSPNNGPI